MKLFSFQSLFANLKTTIHRFPIVSAFAVLATFIGITLVEMEYAPNADYSYLYNLLITSILGFIVFISVRLIVEREKMNFKNRALFEGVFGLLIIGYFFMLPGNWEASYGAEFIRIFLLSLAFFFGITFAPFIKKQEANGFWQYNKTLFIRLFFSGFFGGILFIGTALALTAIDQLLGVNVPSDLYFEIWIFIVGILMSHYFLSGIPEGFKALEKETSYPKGIKFFSQFILIPLMLVYAIILGIYVSKIAISGEWPKGTVSWLILLFSVVGIISHVLLSPLAEKSEHIWIKYFSRIFYVIEIPFIAVLFMAIHIRISTYGLTEARYYVVALGVWLAITALYFLFSKKKTIKLIPVTLFAFILFSSFGPLGAIAMSENNQVSRLEYTLTSEALLVDGHTVKAEEDRVISKKSLREISGVLEYLGSVHGYKKIDPWFEENLEEYLINKKEEYTKAMTSSFYSNEQRCWNDACYIMELMGLNYIDRWTYFDPNEKGVQYLNFNTKHSNMENVAGYDLFVNTYVSNYEQNKSKIEYDGSLYTFRYSQKDNSVEISKDEAVLAVFSLTEVLATLESDYLGTTSDLVDESTMTFISEDENIKVVINNLSLRKEDETMRVESLGLKVFMKK